MTCTGSLFLLHLYVAHGVSYYFSKEIRKTETCEDSSTVFSHAIKAYGVVESRVACILTSALVCFTSRPFALGDTTPSVLCKGNRVEHRVGPGRLGWRKSTASFYKRTTTRQASRPQCSLCTFLATNCMICELWKLTKDVAVTDLGP
jgi:hypothetical protein